MGWQQIVVALIGVAVAGLVVRRLVCWFRGRSTGACSSCESVNCPMHKIKKEMKK